MRRPKCGLCEKHGKTHRKANFGRSRKGHSLLKVLKPRCDRVRRWELE